MDRSSYPFTPGGVSEAMAHEAVFGARNPQLLLRSPDHLVSFRDGEYRTSDPEETDFLLRVVADEARGNRGVWVKHLPPPPPAGASDPPPEEAGPPAIAAPPPPRKRSRARPARKPRAAVAVPDRKDAP